MQRLNTTHLNGLMKFHTAMAYQSGWLMYSRYRQHVETTTSMDWEIISEHCTFIQKVEKWLKEYYVGPLMDGIPKIIR